MNKQQLQQEIAELQKQLEEKQKALAAMPDKWEPKFGEWYITIAGQTDCTGSPVKKVANFGMEYATREQAEKAAKAMRAHNRLLAYVAEFAPWFEADWRCGDGKSFVLFNSESRRWLAATALRDMVAGAVYMPRSVAENLADKLNSGEVEL